MDKKMAKKIKNILIIMVISISFSLLTLSFYYLPTDFDFFGFGKMVHGIEEISVNWRFASKVLVSDSSVTASGAAIHKKNVAEGIYNKIYIITGDEKAIEKMGTISFDRSVWADVLNHFNTNNTPALIYLDPVFTKPSRNPAGDNALIEALSNYQGLVGEDFVLESMPEDQELLFVGKDQDYIDEHANTIRKNMKDYNSVEVQALKRFELTYRKEFDTLTPYPKINLMMDSLANNIKYSGAANIEDVLGIFRKAPLVNAVSYYFEENNQIKITNIYYPSITLSIATLVLKSDIDKVEFKNGKVIIKNAFYDDERINVVIPNQDLEIPVDDRFRMAINYKARVNSGYIKTISLVDATRAGLPKNTILMMGMYALAANMNMWMSPIEDMFGIQHLAYAIGTIVNRDFIHEVPVWLNIVYLIFFTALIGFLVSRGTKFTIIGVVISILFPFLLGFGLFYINIQIFTMLIVINSIVALILSQFYMLQTEQKEKMFIKSTFSSYVNPELVNILIQNPEMMEMSGDQKKVTMLFSDIRGFTTLSESMTPMQLIDFLNIYLSRMTDIVIDTKGTLDKYIGDAVVAFWGAPIELPNHAMSACEAACKMIEVLNAFNYEQRQKGNKPINIGIGLNTGVVTVGNMGSDKKKAYTVLGEHANLTEELQDANKIYGTQICISEFTYEMVKDKVLVRQIDWIRVKDLDRPMKVYELIDVI